MSNLRKFHNCRFYPCSIQWKNVVMLILFPQPINISCISLCLWWKKISLTLLKFIPCANRCFKILFPYIKSYKSNLIFNFWSRYDCYKHIIQYCRNLNELSHLFPSRVSKNQRSGCCMCLVKLGHSNNCTEGK